MMVNAAESCANRTGMGVGAPKLGDRDTAGSAGC